MARLPDPTETLNGADLEAYQRMAAERAYADGRSALGAVYVNMFNNPAVAMIVGQLGAQIRFHGELPDGRSANWRSSGSPPASDSATSGSHHQRPAKLAGITEDVIQSITAGEIPTSLDPPLQAVLRAVDAVAAKQSIPQETQDELVRQFGTPGLIENRDHLRAVRDHGLHRLRLRHRDGRRIPPGALLKGGQVTGRRGWGTVASSRPGRPAERGCDELSGL